MGRPRTPIGTFGEISFVKVAGGQVQAQTRFRDDDGQVRRVSATGVSRKEAERGPHLRSRQTDARAALRLRRVRVTEGGATMWGVSPTVRIQVTGLFEVGPLPSPAGWNGGGPITLMLPVAIAACLIRSKFTGSAGSPARAGSLAVR